MVTPHEAISKALVDIELDGGTAKARRLQEECREEIASAAIEALREGAVERYMAVNRIGDMSHSSPEMQALSMEGYRNQMIDTINAILGLPEENK